MSGRGTWSQVGESRSPALLADRIAHVVWTATPDGRLDYVNARACDYTGLAAAELLDGRLDCLIHPDDVAGARSCWADATGTGQPLSYELRLRRADGQFRWHALRGVPVCDDEGQIVRWLVTATDIDAHISERQRMQAELEEARDMVLSALRAKWQFLANTSHELRTPLTSIMGMTDLLLRTTLDVEQRKMAEAVKRGAEKLLGTIVGILDVSAVTNGNLRLHLDDVAVRPLVEEVREFVEPSARVKGLEFACAFDDDAPPAVHGDPVRIRQMLLHLVENAVKFTDRGRVAIRVTRPEGVEVPSVRFMVADTGIGVPPRDQWRLFRVFSQVDPTDTRRFGGNGLGLALVAQLADAMGGAVGVASSSGRGSTFWFDIPVAGRPRTP